MAAGCSRRRGSAVEDLLNILDERLAAPDERWRQPYKTLLVCEYLIQRGNDACCRRVGEWLADGRLDRLQAFAYVDERGRDQGVNVRHKAKVVCLLFSLLAGRESEALPTV